MDCSPPGSSVHGFLQARILERIATPSSRRSSQPRDRTQVSSTAGRSFTVLATREALWMGPQSPAPGGPSYSSARPRTPREQWTLWAGRALKSLLVSQSPSAGVPTGCLLPQGPHLTGTAPSAPQFWQRSGSVGRWRAAGEGHGASAIRKPGTRREAGPWAWEDPTGRGANGRLSCQPPPERVLGYRGSRRGEKATQRPRSPAPCNRRSRLGGPAETEQITKQCGRLVDISQDNSFKIAAYGHLLFALRGC